MATTTHCSSGPSCTAGLSSSSVAPFVTASKPKKKHCCRVRCASIPRNNNSQSTSRRSMTVALLLSQYFSTPKDAVAGSIFDKYVKRKKLEPLEAYVPALLLTELQFKDLEKTLEATQPQYSSCRSLLRSGPVASLRVNIRAVAQYASYDGNGKAAFDNVDQCLRALEDLDSLLLHASRNDPEASVESMKSKIGIAIGALDRVLKTVPTAVLDKGKEIADAYRIPDEVEAESVDPELQQLESLL